MKARKRIYTADSLGGSKCHAVLAELLNKRPASVARRVARRLQDYHAALISIATITRKSTRLELAKVWRDKFAPTAENTSELFVIDNDFDRLLISYFRACVVLGYRKLIRDEPLNHEQRAAIKKAGAMLNCQCRVESLDNPPQTP